MTMKMFFSSFWLPKNGNSRVEYEDAFFPLKDNEIIDSASHKIAVADGSSEGLLSREWATRLVTLYVENGLHPDNLDEFLNVAYINWDHWKNSEYVPGRRASNKPILWFEEPGLEQGAFSTILGITFMGRSSSQFGEWEAVSIGDSCMFQIRDDELITAFPIIESKEFNNSPYLICSNSHSNKNVVDKLRYTTGRYQIDDRFFLMTDALACWFLDASERGEKPWRFINDLRTDDEEISFEDFVRAFRDAKSLKNDDVTLVRIDIL